MKDRLQRKLLYLKERHGIVGVKGGTEVEDMTFEELQVLKEISENIVPMIVKIGGPEARNDMRFCLKHKIEGILAPMIESEYAFHNFMNSIKEIAEDPNRIFIAVNLETITSYFNLNSIISHPDFELINQITVGRTDLAGSMELPVNHDEVMKVTADIVERVRQKNKITSVGGKVDTYNAQLIRDKINPDKVNTRHVSIDYTKTKNLEYSICEALNFEIDLYKIYIQMAPERAQMYYKRIEDTKRRMMAKNTENVPSLGLTVNI